MDTGWYLPCKKPELSEERKKLCYEEIDVGECEKSWLMEEEKKDCSRTMLLPFCELEDWDLSEEERRYRLENKALLDEQGYGRLNEL